MINLNFRLENPWSSRFENLWHRACATPIKHKWVELEIYKHTAILSVSVNFTVRQDHAGIDLEFGMLGYGIHFCFYDTRHWNRDTNTWATYD